MYRLLAIAMILAASPTQEVQEEQPQEVQQEQSQQETKPRIQWTPPMQRWFAAGNRVIVDFVDEEIGWCAIAIQRPPKEEGAKPHIDCIK